MMSRSCLPDVEDAVLLVPLPAPLREEVVELLLVELDEGHADAHVDLARPPGGLRENVLKRGIQSAVKQN